MNLPRLVIILSCVSLLNDAASEMITPLLPVFLTGVLGAGPAVVGLVEGVAEAAASILKLVSGRLADRGRNPRALVLGGYGISCLARPAMGLCTTWLPVLALRFLDRGGKGLRTSPRDALIAGSVGERARGHAFGFHRGMDHVGSIVGPLLATALLTAGFGLQTVFLLSAIPGVLVLLLLATGLRDQDAPRWTNGAAPLRWSVLDRRLRALVIAAGSLALAVTPEAFLVLWATESGLPLTLVPLLWSAASVVKSATAYLGGRLSDRHGRVPLLLAGWIGRVIVLLALAFTQASGIAVWLLFFAYAAGLSVSEGPERALIGDAAPEGQRGTAFGLYHLTYGLLALPGALLFGALWQYAGRSAAFVMAATLTLAGTAVLAALSRR
jgi:MFS family permease